MAQYRTGITVHVTANGTVIWGHVAAARQHTIVEFVRMLCLNPGCCPLSGLASYICSSDIPVVPYHRAVLMHQVAEPCLR